ncbi:MAG: hypothetical protein A2Z72_05470 [Omnitrophica bacterium RBG_13_46_9]|nr:MAG: hypothetical protein A2Z72_05470 [Omnitrophica bacterium RBG_13_46_9]
MKIALIYPPIPTITTSTSPPVGLAYLAAVLLKKKIDVSVISSDAQGLDVKDTVDQVISISPDIIGISISTPTVNNSLKIIEGAKKSLRDVTIMVGGPHPTLFPEEFLARGADYVIRGEGEETLSEILDHFRQGLPLDAIHGISYKIGERIVHNPDRALIENLDNLPFPEWGLFSIRGYKSDFRRKGFSLPIVSSRGCPAQCTFCYKGIFGDLFRVRSPESIVAEIEYIKTKFKTEEFAIIDDSFTSKPKRAMEVCDLIVSRKIGLPWTLPAGIRVPTASKELLRKLKMAGCYRVGLGLESGNQMILNSIKKGITLEQARRAVCYVKETGMESAGYFMIGNLDETEETIDQTINFAIELDTDYAQFTRATPYPGSAMYSQLKSEKRILSDNWDDYDSFLKSRPIFTHKNLSSERIDEKIREAYRRFYYRPGHLLKYLTAIRSPREFANLLKNAVKFFKTYTK